MSRKSRLSQRPAAEPAALMSRPSTAKRTRKDRARFTYRIDPELNAAANAAVAEYAAAGYQVTVSQVMDAWIAAGYRAWLAGDVEIEIQEQRTARVSRSLRDVASDSEAAPHQARSGTASGAQAAAGSQDPVGWLQSGCGEET